MTEVIHQMRKTDFAEKLSEAVDKRTFWVYWPESESKKLLVQEMRETDQWPYESIFEVGSGKKTVKETVRIRRILFQDGSTIPPEDRERMRDLDLKRKEKIRKEEAKGKDCDEDLVADLMKEPEYTNFVFALECIPVGKCPDCDLVAPLEDLADHPCPIGVCPNCGKKGPIEGHVCPPPKPAPKKPEKKKGPKKEEEKTEDPPPAPDTEDTE